MNGKASEEQQRKQHQYSTVQGAFLHAVKNEMGLCSAVMGWDAASTQSGFPDLLKASQGTLFP